MKGTTLPLGALPRGKRKRWKKCSQHLLIDIIRTVLCWVLWDGMGLGRRYGQIRSRILSQGLSFGGGGVEFLTKGKKGYNTKTMPIWNESS